MNEGEVVLTIDAGVALLEIRNEAKRNAFSSPMTHALGVHLKECEENQDVRCVIITGAGNTAFSSGHDLDEIRESSDEAADPEANKPFTMPRSIAKPTIAAVNGYAYAAGLILASSCDMRIGSSSAVFGAPGVRLGLLPIGGQLSALPQLIGGSNALALLLTGEPMSAKRAYEIGFLNAIVEPDGLQEEALRLARTIAGNAPRVVETTKRAVLEGLQWGSSVAATYEREAGARLLLEPDAEEGVKAFLEKRAPVFQG